MNCGPMIEPEFPDTSEDAVLGGRLRLRQPLKGHRVGHDAILLAAATAAYPGEQAVDLGAGVGAAGLALARRAEALRVSLVEIDPGLCTLAAHNARLNGLDGRIATLCADAGEPQALAAAGLKADGADRVLMNPPFHDPARQNVSPDPRRRLAHVGAPGLLPRWIASAAWLLKSKGVLTLIWRADGEGDVLGALQPAFGDIVLLPVLPRPDRPAIRILLRAKKDGTGALTRLAPLSLNDAEGRPSAAAEAVLRGGEALGIAAF
jgi:tRNA1(Val) A37 N6-methylase TrmN6